MGKKPFNFFENREDALEQLRSSLRMCELMAELHKIPFLAVFEPNGDWMSTFHCFPEDTTSELKAAWDEINGPEEA